MKRAKQRRRQARPMIGVATYVEIKARTMAIARGELRPRRDDPNVWITPNTSEEAIRRVLRKNAELYRRLARA